MQYCGLDLGKKSSAFCIVNDERRLLEEKKVKTRQATLEMEFSGRPPLRIALEASGNAFWVADVLASLGHEVVVVDPGRTKAIGSAAIKHDRLDARVLAILCQANLLARVDRPSEDIRVKRMTIVARDAAVRGRTLLVNAVRSLLSSEGVILSAGAPARFVHIVRELPDSTSQALMMQVEPLVEQISRLTETIRSYDKQIAAHALEDEVMRRLQTIPGVGPVTAAAFVYSVRDPSRFKNGRMVGAYLGLVPSLYSSGQTHRLGRITKRGNRTLRWLLTMSANALMRSRQDTALKRWAEALAERAGKRKAKVALARKLASVMWAIWKKGGAFEPRLPPKPVAHG
jgi:transposase